MKKKIISLETIEKWLEDEDWRVRQAAINACKGRNGVPNEIMEQISVNVNYDIHIFGAKNFKEYTNNPLLRTIEPNEKVYKKCVGGVIVVAKIPQTAQVRGGFNRKCRANESIIVDIIGDVEGEKIGISSYDKTTMYEIGDHVVIENFDYSDEECSTGFHFFNTLEEAKNYEF